MKGDNATKSKAKADIFNYFSIVNDHAKNHPDEILDYEALKACFNINAN